MTVTPETLTQWADKIDARLGPISGADSDKLAVLLREAAAQLAGIPHPTGSETFAKALADLGFPAPWRVNGPFGKSPPEVWAENGAVVASLDPFQYLNDEDKDLALFRWIILSVNTLAGFKAQAPK